MVRVNLPDGFPSNSLFGEDVQTDEDGKFIETGETYAAIAVASHGGVIVGESAPEKKGKK